MKHRSFAFVTVLLVVLLCWGFPARPALAGVQSDKEAQAEPPDEPQEEEEPAPEEPEEEPQEEPPPPQEQPQQPAPQPAPPIQQPAPQQTPLLTPPPPQNMPASPMPQTPAVPIPAPTTPNAPATVGAPPPKPPATSTTTMPSPAPQTAAPAAAPSAPPKPIKLPSSLLKTQARLLSGPLGQDPAALALFAAVQSEKATASDFNDAAVFLARKGFIKDAEGYADVAVKMDEKNRDYWLNYGTIRLQVGTLSSALTAYKKARDLDPNFGFTWYSIGVVYDYMRSYDKAVEAYTMALSLDPDLGDSKKNPQVVNNGRLMVVNLLLYREKVGGLAMPLMGGPPVAKPPAPAATTSQKTP